MVSTRLVLGVPTLGVYTEERRRRSNVKKRKMALRGVKWRSKKYA